MESNFFELNSKTIKILCPVDDLLNEDKTDFKGSKEKFYWTQILLISIIASKNNYTLDISDYEDFIANYESVFSPTSDKFNRFKTVLAYLKKLQRGLNECMQKIYYLQEQVKVFILTKYLKTRIFQKKTYLELPFTQSLLIQIL